MIIVALKIILFLFGAIICLISAHGDIKNTQGSILGGSLIICAGAL